LNLTGIVNHRPARSRRAPSVNNASAENEFAAPACSQDVTTTTTTMKE
jgi:hypothetical protein